MGNFAGRNFATVGELERENFNLARIQEWAGLNFEAKMSRVLDRAAARIEIKLRGAERTRQGNFKITSLNQALALNIGADLSRVLNDAGYTDIVNEHLGNYSGLFTQAKRLYAASGIPFAFDQADIDILQHIADHDATYFGRLPELGVAAVEKALAESILVGSNFQVAAQAIQGALGGSGWLARFAYTYANDSLLNFSASMSAIRDQKHKPEFYYYAGALIKTSRPFCIARAGKVFPAASVQQWEKWDWRGKKPGPFLIVRGGWNCKHSMIGVSKAWMEANDMEPESGPGEEPEAPKRRKPPGLTGATYLPGATRLSSLSTWTGPVPGLKEPPGTPRIPSPRVKPPATVKTKTPVTKTTPWPKTTPAAKPVEQKVKEQPKPPPEKKGRFVRVATMAAGRRRLEGIVARLEETGAVRYPVNLGPAKVSLTRDMDLNVLNHIIKKLEDLQGRAIKMKIPPLHSLEVSGKKPSLAGSMGGGRMYLNSKVAERRFQKPYKGSVKWEIGRKETRIGVLENAIKAAGTGGPLGARDQPARGQRPTEADVRGMKEELKRTKTALRKLKKEAEQPYDPRALWKQGDDVTMRPQNVIDYFMPGTPEAVWKTIEHEFGHHIHQNLFVTDSNQYWDRGLRPMETYLKRLFRGRSVQPSTYADHDHMEYLAENYALWQLGRKELVAPELKPLLRKLDKLPTMTESEELSFFDFLAGT